MSETFKPLDATAFITGQTRGVSTTKSWWQYARDTRNIARNSRITLPTGAELAALKTFVDVIVRWDATANDGAGGYVGTRPWLGIKLNIKAISQDTEYVGDTSVEPAYVLVKYIEHISRDFKKIPVNDTETSAVDALITATGNRRLGTGRIFGNVIGEKPTT